MTLFRSPLIRLIPVAVAVCVAGPTYGQFEYTIDQNQSQLNLTASGDVFGGALEVSEQHPNSPTRYDGTINASFPNTPRPGGSIRFQGGGSANGQTLRGGFFNSELDVTPGIGGSGNGDPANYGIDFSLPLNNPIALPDIPLPAELGGITLSLGELSSVQLSLALRDVAWDIVHNVPGGKSALDASGQFDASQGIQLGLVGGFADINGALVLTQENLIAAGLLELGLNTLAGALPDLGLTVSRPNIFSSDVLIGIGTRIDLGGLAGNLLLPNGATDPATLTFDELTGASTLTLPVDISLQDFGLPPELIDLELGFSGQFVATSTVAVPEPASTIWLLAMSVGIAGVRSRRHRLL